MQEATAELVEALVEMRMSSGPPSEAALAGLMSLLQAVQAWMNLNHSLRALLQWWKAGIMVDTRPEGPLFTEHKLADFLVKQVLVSCGVPLSHLCASYQTNTTDARRVVQVQLAAGTTATHVCTPPHVRRSPCTTCITSTLIIATTSPFIGAQLMSVSIIACTKCILHTCCHILVWLCS
jgi:hypothetical protein